MTTPETQLASLFAKYEPAQAKLGKALRTKLRTRLPGFFEIVYFYENQHSLVLSYSPTPNGFEGVCTIAVNPDGVKLYFGQAAQLSKSDPNKLLQGTAKTVRFVPLDSLAAFNRPELQSLIAAAIKLVKLLPDPKSPTSLILKADSQKQRALRKSKSPRLAASRRMPKSRS